MPGYLIFEAVGTFEQWWQILEENEARLDETGYLLDMILERVQFAIPRIETVSAIYGVVLGLMVAWNRLVHGKSWSVSRLFLPKEVEDLVRGYRTYKGL